MGTIFIGHKTTEQKTSSPNRSWQLCLVVVVVVLWVQYLLALMSINFVPHLSAGVCVPLVKVVGPQYCSNTTLAVDDRTRTDEVVYTLFSLLRRGQSARAREFVILAAAIIASITGC